MKRINQIAISFIVALVFITISPLSTFATTTDTYYRTNDKTKAVVDSTGDVCRLIKENGKYYTIQCRRNGNGIKASVGNVRSICWACGLTVDPDGTIIKVDDASDSGVTRADTSDYADEVLRLINEERANVGLDELMEDSYLSEVACERSKEVVNKSGHTRPDGTTVGDLGLGENCYYGRGNSQAAVKAWMNSAGHKANILNEAYVSFGAGCYQSESGKFFVVVTFRKS